MDIVAKLTIVFSGAGAIAGIISGFLPNAWLALLVALILIYATYKLTTYYIKKSAAQPALPAHQTPGQTPAQPLPVKKKAVLKGFMLLFATLVTKGETDEKETEVKFWLLPYFVMWLVLWIMVYTLLLLG